MVELKLPNIGLGSLEARNSFITAAAGIVAELCVPGHRPENTWINIVDAPDGGWGIGDRPDARQGIAAATAAAQ